MERNLATVVAIVNDRPTKGTFFNGSKIKEVRHKYFNIRKRLQEKRGLNAIKMLRGKERRMMNQELHKIFKKIIEYAKQFLSPVIIMEKLKGIRENFGGEDAPRRSLETPKPHPRE